MSTASHAWSLPASCARVSAARRRSARASAERSTPGSGHSDAERSVPSSARVFSRRAMASVALSLVLLGTCAVPLVAASSEGESKVLMDAIRAHRVVIVSKSYCPYSRAVKKLFNEQYPEVYPHVIEIDQARGLNMASFQSMLMETYGYRTVPQVFVGAKRVGGSDETFRAHVDGTLARLLDDASGFDNSPSSYDAGASEEAPERRQAAQVTAETASVTDPTSDDDDDELAKIQAEIAAWEAEGKTEREEGADGWGGQMEAVQMDAEEETQF